MGFEDELPPDIVRFCGFNMNGTDFRTKFLLDERSMTITPCAEFGLISMQSIPFLFFLVVNICLVERHFPRFQTSNIWWLFVMKMCISMFTAMMLFLMILIGTFSLYRVKSVVMIEYGILGISWAVAGMTWGLSVHYNSWTRTRALIVTGFFASKCTFLIAANRWIMFGFLDIRTLLPFTVAIAHILYSMLNFVEWRIKRNSDASTGPFSPLDGRPSDYIRLDRDADEEAGFFSKLFFCWTNALVKKGGKYQLNELDDVFNLPPTLRVSTIERQFVENSPTFFSDAQQFSIARSLLSTFGVQYFSLAILRIIADAFNFASPILLHLLVNSLEDTNPRNDSFLYASLLIICCFAGAIIFTHFSYYVEKISLKVRAATVIAIYDKLLKVPLAEMSSFSSGQILNFISTDVDRIVNFCNSFHAFWNLPLELVITLYLLYREVGMAFISGLLAAIILIPINKVITSKIGKMSEKMMTAKDHRVKMITEAMHGIRTVKLCAWEDYFQEKIGRLRAKELKYLKARKYLDAICVYLWASAPLLITISIIATYTLVLHEKLTAAKIFTALALVNILIMPLNAFPWVLNGLVEALVSVKRLEWFFALKEFDLHEFYNLTQNEKELMSVRRGSFYWKDSSEKRVSNVSITGEKGSIVGVYGEVGSGKSTFLLGLLGETRGENSAIGLRQESVSQGIAYIGQTHWLVRGTVRDNILCGKDFNPIFYEKVIAACCLQKDINNMPGGDQYEISDNGATLSGGQRARISLARALYQDNTVYLLDDPFASLDKPVAHTIWTEAIEKMLKNRGKLVIVSCHNIQLLNKADHILMFNKTGYMQKEGSPAEVFDQELIPENVVEIESSEKAREVEEEIEFVGTQDEEKQTGSVKVSIYGAYMKSAGIFLSVAIMGALLAMQVSKNLADMWLAEWTAWTGENVTKVEEQNNWKGLLSGERHYELLTDSDWDRSIYFLCVYAIIAAANTIFTLIRAFLFAYGGVAAAKKLHKKLLVKLLKASLQWWDRTPSGRVINRMCSDVYTVDDNLPFQLNIVLASLFNLIGTLVVTLIGLPILVPIVLALFIIYYFTQRYYRRTTVELKRLTSVSLSPLYSHLSDTVNGLATIRAHRFVNRMTHKLREKLSASLRAQFSSLAAGKWLAIRLSLIAVAVVSAVSLGAIIQHRIHPVESGLIGLAITYALSLTSLLNGLLGSFIETEKEMVSVERIDEYIREVNEEKDEKEFELPTTNLKIDFDKISLRYEKGLQLALDKVDLSVTPGERVAIIGRTGSGKSSLFQALLRGVSLESGKITISGVDIAKVGLDELRKCFGLVPQNPFLFSGTLWENLTVDSEMETDRGIVVRLVRNAGLENLIERVGGLDGEIAESGSNLSHGEKQIIALCRVLIRKPKIVLIDEATAHLDSISHERMLGLIKQELPSCTLLSIVHNLHGLDSYDRVIEMENGKIRWHGPPQQRHQ
ncbi:unnamed protein product, partial [Mesorhabditis belari]|uniref:ABC-type xenobiotic transporter n=1 Tax=Mesorhabditis belari TaxID=2138241 RepID=A0AAF3EWB3_9BILA